MKEGGKYECIMIYRKGKAIHTHTERRPTVVQDEIDAEHTTTTTTT
jgi:hypothetical protein